MPKEITIYGGINTYIAELFIQQLKEAEGEDITVFMDTPGGDPQAAFGMLARFQAFEGRKSIEVHGRALSAGAFFLCYADNVTALDVSEITIHRAAYPNWLEADKELFDDAAKKSLGIVNESLKKALKAKVNTNLFKEISGKSINDVFSMDSRIDVTLTAKEAKRIGLIDRIEPLTLQKRAAIETNKQAVVGLQMAAMVTELPEVSAQKTIEFEKQKEEKNAKIETMDINKLRTEHPEIYAAAVSIGEKQERDRAGAYLVFADVDLKMVKEGIQSGEAMSATMQAELTRKSISKDALVDLEKNATGDIETSTPEKEAVDKKDKGGKKPEIEAFLKRVDDLREKSKMN